jgi:S1-C subfamily serine protease
VDTENQIVPQLMKFGKITRPGLGISILADQIAQQNHIDGVVIVQVVPGGAADQAGLVGAKSSQSGVEIDDVIVGLEGVEVHHANDLYKALDTHKVGDTVDVAVENHGKRRTAKVTLQAVQ